MKIKFSTRFNKRYRKIPAKIQIATNKRVILFQNDKYYPVLNNHALAGKWAGYRSINITGDWRALFREFDNGSLIYFDIIDTHSNLYRH
jgi:addiction module RelE/StbE family toxin|tara:strand:+ start:543 stop:809 length:267 start_codon:yes stop_codon:yes gene_type:complete